MNIVASFTCMGAKSDMYDALPWNPGGGGPIPGGGKGGPPGGPIAPGGGCGRPPGPGGKGGRAYEGFTSEQRLGAKNAGLRNPGAPGGPPKPGGGTNPGPLGVRCCGPKPNPPGGGPPPDSYADVIWSMMLCALSWPRAGKKQRHE